MAMLVADIGGTSSRWGVLRAGAEPVIIDGLPGFNPATGAPEPFVEAVSAQAMAEDLSPEGLYVYAAGCGSPERAARMADALRMIWPGAKAEVATDLLGAARGLLGDAPGLVLILGTGMNFGRYDGRVVHQTVPSVGWILGDEGSGADIGKHLLRDALRGNVPMDVMQAVFPEGLAVPVMIERLYRGERPQTWLAAFTGRLAPLADHPWVRGLVGGRFRELAGVLAASSGEYPERGIQATGSVAYGFGDLLREALLQERFSLVDVWASPLPGLLRYHAARLPR